MKTRIISGIILGAIVAAVLIFGFLVSKAIIVVAVALLAAAAAYELLKAAEISDKISLIGAAVGSFLIVLTNINIPLFSNFGGVIVIGSLYAVFAVVMILKNHAEFDLAKIAVSYAFPIVFGVAFFLLCRIIISDGGIYYLLLLLNFSSVCDMGAYFVGVKFGKRKLCPSISPKKTVEGALGGIASSIVVTLILSLCFKTSIIMPMLLTIPFCILGMIGDLFASAIKRSVGLKDYGNLIPGHGGIMDRLDSIIMIAPLLFVCIGFSLI